MNLFTKVDGTPFLFYMNGFFLWQNVSHAVFGRNKMKSLSLPIFSTLIEDFSNQFLLINLVLF